MSTATVTPQATSDPFASIAQPVQSAQTSDPFATIAQPVNQQPNDYLSKTEDFLGTATSGVEKGVGDLWDMAKSLPGSIYHSLPPVALADSVKQTLPVIDSYEKARASGASITDALSAANQKAKDQEVIVRAVKERAAEFQKNPTMETARGLTDLAGLVAVHYLTGGAGAEVEGLEGAADVGGAAEPEAAATAEPGIVKQVLQGAKAAQPGTQAAVRSGVQASSEAAGTADESLAANITNTPIVNGGNTVVDEPLATLREQEQAAYNKMDETAGFDVKAEKEQLANDQYKLKQLGNTDADITQRGNLIESINDSQDRIAEASQKMQDAGIDPSTADTLHQQRMAGQDFRKSLIKNTNAGSGDLNIDGLLNDAKNLQNSKYGNRLEQFMGKDGAAKYVDQLQQMQKLGASAVKANKLAKLVGGWAAGGVVGGVAASLGYEALK